MIALRTVLLLLGGITIASCCVLRNEKPCVNGHELPAIKPIEIPKPPELPPLPEYSAPYVNEIKPQYIPELHDNTGPQQKPSEIPEAPVIPSFAIPELPPVILPVSPEYSSIIEVQPPPETIEIPEAPVLPPFTSEKQEVIVEPVPEPIEIIIPEAPKLPSATQPIPECEQSTIVEVHNPNPIEIPEAPVLPPFTIPEIPTFVEVEPVPNPGTVEILIPEPPTLALFPQPEPECDDHIEPNTTIIVEPIAIPEAPVLPPFTMPEIPTVVEVEPVPKPEPVEILISEPPLLAVFPPAVLECDKQPAPNAPTIVKPIPIAEAPVLPPFTMPELPTVVLPDTPEVLEFQTALEPKPFEIPEAPSLPPQPIPDCEDIPTHKKPTFTEVIPEPNLIKIPEAPVLPPFALPELPSVIIPETIDVDVETKPEYPEIVLENSVFDCEEDQVPSVPLNIPEAPKLPAMTEDLKPVEILRPAADSDCPPTNNIDEPGPGIEHFEIPAPPQLSVIEISAQPISIAVPEAPKMPAITLPIPIYPEVIEYQPLPSIPEAPKLPPFEATHIPTNIIEENTAIEIEPIHQIEEQLKLLEEIPPPPVLPAVEIPIGEVKLESEVAQLPTMQPIIVAERKEEPCRDDKKSVYQKIIQPTFWAQNIIIDRVLSNMVVSDKEYAKSLGEGIKYPVITKPYFV